jgi:hypothetical protein
MSVGPWKMRQVMRVMSIVGRLVAAWEVEMFWQSKEEVEEGPDAVE